MENLSLFNMPEPAQEQMKFQHSNKLDVVKMEFVGAETMTWQDLFSGFDTLHAITYSSGINFIYRLLDFFEEAEAATKYFLTVLRVDGCQAERRDRPLAGLSK